MIGAAMMPPMPTRQEVAAFCNASPFRIKQVTVSTVRWWESMGYIKRHPAYLKPARYIAGQVLRFLDGEV